MITIQVTGTGQGTPVYQGFPFGLQFYAFNETGPEEGVTIDVQTNVAANGATGYFATGQPEASYAQAVTGPDGYSNILPMYANGVEGSWDLFWYLWIPFNGPDHGTMTNQAPSGAAVATSITTTAGDNQTVAPSTALPVAFTVQVKDQYGAPFTTPVNITATAPASGSSGVFATTGTNVKTVATNASGIASFGTFTSNATAGSFYVNFSGSSLSPSRALIKVQVPTSEVCTPPSKMENVNNTAAEWQNGIRWWTGAADSSNYAVITVASDQSTPAQSLIAFNFDPAQLALIDDQAVITSMTLAWRAYCTKGGIYTPDGFVGYMSLADRGTITATFNANGSDSIWSNESRQWTTFTNTGNPDNKPRGAQLKNSNLYAVLQFNGSSSNAGGQYRSNGASLIICYINPAVSSEQAQSLQLCIL